MPSFQWIGLRRASRIRLPSATTAPRHVQFLQLIPLGCHQIINAQQDVVAVGPFVRLANRLLVDGAIDGFLVADALAADVPGAPPSQASVSAISIQALFADSVRSMRTETPGPHCL